MTQTVILHGPIQRANAKRLIDAAGDGFVVKVSPPKRSTDQNALLWSLLSELSQAKPEGRHWTPETWKCAMMHAVGHQVQFCEGLDGCGPFPIGFRSSRLTKSQMSTLIEAVYEYGARHGVRFQDKEAA